MITARFCLSVCDSGSRLYRSEVYYIKLTKLEFMTRAKRLSNTDIPVYLSRFAVFLYVHPDSV